MKNPSGKSTSIAVLPFNNISSHPGNEFFCDGITEEIIDTLAKIDGLKVISRTSSFFFKNHKSSLREISEKLQVTNLLEGSVRLADQNMRIKAQLINVAEDEVFWTETWDRKTEKLFKVQDEISLQIADKLREHYGHLEISDQLTETGTSSLSAYEHLLKGRHHFYKWNPEDTNKAITYFDQSIQQDPQLIDAYLGLADSYSFMAVAGFAPREEAWQKSSQAIKEAKKLNPDHAGLNYLLGFEAFFTQADFASAMRYGMKSLAANPTYSEAHQFVSFLNLIRGDFSKAWEHIQFAKSVDPLNPETRFYEANYYYRTGDYVKAKTILDQLLEENERNLPAVIVNIYILIKEGHLNEALHSIEKVPQEAFTSDERLGLLSLIDASLGKSTEHIQILERRATEENAHHAHAYLFEVYAQLRRHDEAFEVLSYLFNHASSILQLTFSDPLSSKIHHDERWKEYHSRIYAFDQEQPTHKSTRSAQSDPETIKNQIAQLTSFMESEQPFLNPSLSLRSLAEQIELHPNQLSWLLNERVGKNFNEYINHHRIQHFKQLILDPDNSHISILGLAYESGFNSKTVFNTAFKKQVGMTPKAFQKSQQ